MLGLRFLSTLVKPDFFKVATLENLRETNRQLREMGLPDFFMGFGRSSKMFNPSYQINPKAPPRFVVGLNGLRLTELYLLPSVSKGSPDYIYFVNKFYQDEATENLPTFLNSPEIVIRF